MSLWIISSLLSIALVIATLMVLNLRRQCRGLHAMLHRILKQEFYRTDEK